MRIPDADRQSVWLVAASFFFLVFALGDRTLVHAQQLAISTCGQVVPPSAFAFLTADLDCSGLAGAAIELRANAKLDLAGFSVSAGSGDGIRCEDRCRIFSDDAKGTINGFAGDGIVANRLADDMVRVILSNVSVQDNLGNGISIAAPGKSSLRVRKSEVLRNGAAGVVGLSLVKVVTSVISANQLQGIAGARIQVRDSTIEQNGVGIESTEYLKVDTCDITDNLGDGVRADVAFKSQRMNLLRNGGSGLVLGSIDGPGKVFFSEISENAQNGVQVTGSQTGRLRFKFAFIRFNGGNGIVSRDLRLGFSRVDGNAWHGVFAETGAGQCKIRIDRFSLVNNGTDPACGVSVPCADIASCDPPLNLTPETDCGTSYDTGSGFPGSSWSICDGD